MRKPMGYLIPVVALHLLCAAWAVGAPSIWQSAGEGLEVAAMKAPETPSVGDGTIYIVRVDPERYSLKLLSVKWGDAPHNLALPDWVKRHGLHAAINGGMYQGDHQTSVGHMRRGHQINREGWNKYKAALAIAPREEGLPEVRLLDRVCDDWEALAQQTYTSVLQGIRMVDCKRSNRWQKQDKRWSVAAIGEDSVGRMLLIHSRSPWPVHDFINFLLGFPIDLQRAMYLEGGPEASLVVRTQNYSLERIGSFETGFFPSDANIRFWKIPNVIGVVPRSGAKSE